MAGNDIEEVNLNYHGSNQAIHLDVSNNPQQYITSTGNGRTNESGTPATNVQDLPIPSGNIDNARLNINTCKLNCKTQYELKGSKQTLMESFYKTFNFKTVRGTVHGVSYDRKTKQPFPGHSWRREKWEYMNKNSSQKNYPGVGLPPK